MTAEIRELLPLYALNALAAEEHLRLEAHLEDCAECQSELRELRELCADLGTITDTEPPPSLKHRLMASVQEAPQKRGVVFDSSGILLARSGEIPWRTLFPGVESKLLFKDRDRGYSTRLVRIAAGGKYPRHHHSDAEELYVLSGDLHVEGATAGPGDYCRAGASSIHREAYSIHGCTFLVMASHDDEVLA